MSKSTCHISTNRTTKASKMNPKITETELSLTTLPARLESMPIELLQIIFHHSENLNLPICAPRIGRKLSSKYTLQQTIMSHFGPSWTYSFIEVYSFYKADQNKILRATNAQVERQAAELKAENNIPRMYLGGLSKVCYYLRILTQYTNILS